MSVTLSQKETAQFLGMSYKGFLEHRTALIRAYGLPLPYIGDPFSSRAGPRCRWVERDLILWRDHPESRIIPLAPETLTDKTSPAMAAQIHRPANDDHTGDIIQNALRALRRQT
jgi:hypothetical protein